MGVKGTALPFVPCKDTLSDLFPIVWVSNKNPHHHSTRCGLTWLACWKGFYTWTFPISCCWNAVFPAFSTNFLPFISYVVHGICCDWNAQRSVAVIEDALVDMWILGEADEMIVSTWSTFGYVCNTRLGVVALINVQWMNVASGWVVETLLCHGRYSS